MPFLKHYFQKCKKTENLVITFVLLIVIGNWGGWSSCSKSCDTGTQQRTRSCSGHCQNVETVENRDCTIRLCPPGK